MGHNGSNGNGASSRRGNVVDEGTIFKGIITSSSTVTVRGVLEGEVEGPALEIEPGGVLIGKAKVTELRSRGELAGQFQADDVELSGRVRDDTVIRASSLLVSPGSVLSADGHPVAEFGGCQLEVGEVPSKEEILKRVLAAGNTEEPPVITIIPPGPPSAPPISPPGAPDTDGGPAANRKKRPPADRPTEGGV